MTGREWKPGVVAAIPFGRGDVRAIYTGAGWVSCDDPTPRNVPYVRVRPLVVIDPEDREQVERLNEAYWATVDEDGQADMAAALREFANPTPPKPDEPTGLGAVVEDDKQRRWVRVGINTLNGAESWQCSTTEMGWVAYADIAAVRVLSPGVTP